MKFNITSGYMTSGRRAYEDCVNYLEENKIPIRKMDNSKLGLTFVVGINKFFLFFTYSKLYIKKEKEKEIQVKDLKHFLEIIKHEKV